MAEASGVSFRFDSTAVPLLSGAYDLAENGCIPGACFRNQEFVEAQLAVKKQVDYNRKMLMLDAQTSGGLLMCIPEKVATGAVLDDLHEGGYPHAAIVGNVVAKEGTALVVG